MNLLLRSIILIAIGSILAGCPKVRNPQPAAQQGAGDTAELSQRAAGAAHGDAAHAQRELDAAQGDRIGRVASDSDAAHRALNEGRTDDAKGAVRVQLAHLEGVQRNAEEAARLAEAEQHRAEGRADQAEETLDGLRESAKADAVKIADLERARDTALQRASEADERARKALADYKNECEQNMRRQQKAIDDALDEQNKAVLADQVRKLNWCGVIGIVAAAVVVGAGWLAMGATGGIGAVLSLKKTVPLAVLLAAAGLWCFAAAQIIGWRWFLPTMGAITLVVLALVGIWFRKHIAQNDLTTALKEKYEKVAGLYNQVSPLLDEVYENGKTKLSEISSALKADGTATVQDLMDHLIFNRLSSTMDKKDKKLVQSVRAENS